MNLVSVDSIKPKKGEDSTYNTLNISSAVNGFTLQGMSGAIIATNLEEVLTAVKQYFKGVKK